MDVTVWGELNGPECRQRILVINTFTAIVDLSRSNFSIARAPLFQLKSAM